MTNEISPVQAGTDLLPSVSVVIPTVGRKSLSNAIRSAQRQLDCSIEVIVVLDKIENEPAVKALCAKMDAIYLPGTGLGAPSARNIGLSYASGDYIGYLDDDDEWVPEKCSVQISQIRLQVNPDQCFSVALSNFRSSQNQIVQVQGKSKLSIGQNIANYLVERKTIRYGSTYFQSASLLGPNALMKKTTWDEKLSKHQDWDVFIQLVMSHDAHPVQISQKLVIISQGSSGSISRSPNWQGSLHWANKHRAKLSGRAKSDFAYIHIVGNAIAAGSLKGVVSGIKTAGPTPPHFAAIIRTLFSIPIFRKWL